MVVKVSGLGVPEPLRIGFTLVGGHVPCGSTASTVSRRRPVGSVVCGQAQIVWIQVHGGSPRRPSNASSRGADDALFVSTDGFALEGTTSALIVRVGGGW